MLSDIDFIAQSIEINLAYGLSIREMTLDLELSFLPKDNYYIKTTDSFFKAFDALVDETISISSGNIPQALFDNKDVIVTKYTLKTYQMTEELTGVNMNQDLVFKLNDIKPGIPNPTKELLKKVKQINEQAKILLINFKKFLEDVYNRAINVELFIFSYGLLIEHLIDRINLYYYSISRLVDREDLSPTYVATVQYDFNNLVKQDAMFLNALVNQKEDNIIKRAREFENAFMELLNTYQIPLTPDNQQLLSKRSLTLNNEFIKFVEEILDRVINKNIQFMVEPVFIDIILRESNLFSFILAGNIVELSIDYQNIKKSNTSINPI